MIEMNLKSNFYPQVEIKFDKLKSFVQSGLRDYNAEFPLRNVTFWNKPKGSWQIDALLPPCTLTNLALQMVSGVLEIIHYSYSTCDIHLPRKFRGYWTVRGQFVQSEHMYNKSLGMIGCSLQNPATTELEL